MAETSGGFVAYRHNKATTKWVSHGDHFLHWRWFAVETREAAWRRNRGSNLRRRHLTPRGATPREETLIAGLISNAIFSLSFLGFKSHCHLHIPCCSPLLVGSGRGLWEEERARKKTIVKKNGGKTKHNRRKNDGDGIVNEGIEGGDASDDSRVPKSFKMTNQEPTSELRRKTRFQSSEDEAEKDRGDVQRSGMKRVELPMFEGVDPMGWIAKADKFFDLHNVTERKKMKLVYICMERGANYYWIRFWQKKTRHPNWKMFTEAMTRRFGGLNRGTILENVNEYTQEFEILVAQASSVGEKMTEVRQEGSVNAGGGQEDEEDEKINNLLDLENMGKGMGETELKLSTHQPPLLI
ncbi:hypothetical protein V8G54_022953 [Vigna mungo]|uniref:Retrotransposon gag domain-containing protein n=1 Tax=Vigna mungo TaxID=3915 RepID=A0AAQ3RPV7_VIGMU